MFREAAPSLGLQPADCRVALQGFGNVGSWAARIIAQLGATVTAVSDAHGAVHAEDGLDPEALALHVREGGKVAEYEGDGAEPITPEELLALECEAFIPAALGGMIHAGNADLLDTRIVVEGANSPTTPKADEILAEKGVLVVPDVMANAGGVVVSYFEWVQNLQHFRWDEREVNEKLGTIMRRTYREVSARASEDEVPMRVAAYQTGIERVVDAARTRGYIS
jgi:glutamate dehydrogenase/leucine dehydrogenase